MSQESARTRRLSASNAPLPVKQPRRLSAAPPVRPSQSPASSPQPPPKHQAPPASYLDGIPKPRRAALAPLKKQCSFTTDDIPYMKPSPEPSDVTSLSQSSLSSSTASSSTDASLSSSRSSRSSSISGSVDADFATAKPTSSSLPSISKPAYMMRTAAAEPTTPTTPTIPASAPSPVPPRPPRIGRMAITSMPPPPSPPSPSLQQQQQQQQQPPQQPPPPVLEPLAVLKTQALILRKMLNDWLEPEHPHRQEILSQFELVMRAIPPSPTGGILKSKPTLPPLPAYAQSPAHEAATLSRSQPLADRTPEPEPPMTPRSAVRHQQLISELNSRADTAVKLRETTGPKKRRPTSIKLTGTHKLLRKASRGALFEVLQSPVKPTESQQKRLKVIEELIDTERNFVTDMVLVLNVFAKPLATKQILTPYQHSLLFCNTEQVMQLSKQLLQLFLEQNSLPLAEQNFGQIFLTKSNEICKVYKIYCANLVLSDYIRKNLPARNKQFAQFLEERFTTTACAKQDLKTFLIKPLQRLCKYPLLLKEMRKYDANPDSAANSMLAQAFDRMERVVAEVNECMLESDTQAQVLQVQELFSTESQDLELAKPFRRMICKDLFPHVLYRAKEKKNRVIESHFFLMSDVLVVGVERNRRYLLSAVLPLERCTVDLVDCKNDSMRLGRDVEHVLRIKRSDIEPVWGESGFLMVFQLADDLQLWFSNVSQAIAETQGLQTSEDDDDGSNE